MSALYCPPDLCVRTGTSDATVMASWLATESWITCWRECRQHRLLGSYYCYISVDLDTICTMWGGPREITLGVLLGPTQFEVSAACRRTKLGGAAPGLAQSRRRRAHVGDFQQYGLTRGLIFKTCVTSKNETITNKTRSKDHHISPSSKRLLS